MKALKAQRKLMNDINTNPNDDSKSNPSFESAMIELEALVTKIETGNLSLEDSLKEFENGIKLSRVCQSALKDAEHRVKILSDDEEQDFVTNSDIPSSDNTSSNNTTSPKLL